MANITFQVTERQSGAIARINDNQNHIRTMARARNMCRAEIIHHYKQPNLTGRDKDIRECMGDDELYNIADAIGYQENIQYTRGKSGSLSVTKNQLLNGNRQIRVMGEILDINTNRLITDFRRGYIDLLNKSRITFLDATSSQRIARNSTPNNPQAIHAKKNYLFYAIYKGNYEAYIGRTENRNIQAPNLDIDRRKSQHQAARSVGNSILLSGGIMIIIDSAQGITEGEADIKEDAWIDAYFMKVKHVRNDKYNVAGRGAVNARQPNAATSANSKRQGAIWNNKINSSRKALKQFGPLMMDTIKFLYDNPNIQPYSVHNNNILKQYGCLPNCVSHCITHLRLERYKVNVLTGVPHNQDIPNCENWSGVYSPITIPLTLFK